MKHGFRTFLAVLCIFPYIRAELSIYIRGHRKDTGSRYVVETLFHYSRQVREAIYI